MPDFRHGENLSIGKYVVVEKDCQIGDNVTIEDFVVLKSGTIIGNDCYIHAGAKIGAPTFNLTLENGTRKRTIQMGVTVIEHGVDIGYNTVIQRGVERNTIIGENTFINNLCNIGHDVQINSGCTIGLGVRMSGYTEIGANTIISPGVTILNRVKIGQNSFVGIGSLVLHDISDSTTVTGRPAVELGLYKAERRALKEILNLNVKSPTIATRKRGPLATRKRWWRKKLKRVKIWIISRLFTN